MLKEFIEESNTITLAHPVAMMPKGSSVAALGLKEYVSGKAQDCFTVEPFYIRKSNAEEKWEEKYGGENPK